MQLGYSITSFHPADVDPRTAARRIVDRAETARDAGYDYVQAGDHHNVAGGGYLQNVPTTGRLSAVFDRVATMFLLPLYDPVLVAEQAGTLAALTEEFDFWCAVGGGPEQFEAFDVPVAERAPRFEEGLRLLDRLWREDEVTFDGEYYAVEDVSVNPKFDGRICVGAGAEPAVRRAGRMGDAWVAGPALSVEDLRTKLAWFDDAGGGDIVVRREALVLEDDRRAAELANEKLSAGYRGWPSDADWVLAGDDSSILVDLQRLDDLGVDEVVVRPMSDAHAAETLEGVARARDRL